ncbi:hypothetical protein EHQ23_17780 [Leptospira bourretii]|uniref:Glycosyltransferase RgtA/B/C/D-like domain-containing protein n=2 Tax=Leptospira bourretii TaxID=2484962 RepID=A0A5K1T625_9LEPT|nr:hypothetical protein [Leptospira bourretii]TGK79457.1 hypothetical protein EHQ23_17780 [Leptospira bourretii]TGL19572.1 hypothetical protein EHQ47_15830 [Leptospira bourretii]
MKMRFQISILFIVFLFLTMIPVYYKYHWNQPNVAIGSDPQIKYYQTYSYYKEGFSPYSRQCFFPAGVFGFQLQNIPLGYPWALSASNDTCFFQYPIFMPVLHAFMARMTSFTFVIYFPIFFFFLNLVLLFIFFKQFGLSVVQSGCASLFIHFFSPVFLSSLDYSELTLTNTFFILSLLFYKRIFLSNNINISAYLFVFLSGICLSFNFQLRPESTLALLLFFFVNFVRNVKDRTNFRILFSIGIVSFLSTFAFSYWNQKVYGHFMGMRGLNTIHDTAILNLGDYLVNWTSDLWGSKYKIGLFKGYPFAVLFIVPFLFSFVQKLKNVKLNDYLISGYLFILLLPFVSPYRAGVDILGLRYYESGVYLMSIGFFLWVFQIFSSGKYIQNSQIAIITFVLLFLTTLYFSYKSNLRAIKHWSGAAKVSHEYSDLISKINPDLIIHRGLSTTYLMGVTYLEYPQIAVYSQDEWDQIEHVVLKNGFKRILYLYWQDNKLVNYEFPKEIWEKKFNVNFDLSLNSIWDREKIKIIHFDSLLMQKK